MSRASPDGVDVLIMVLGLFAVLVGLLFVFGVLTSDRVGGQATALGVGLLLFVQGVRTIYDTR